MEKAKENEELKMKNEGNTPPVRRRTTSPWQGRKSWLVFERSLDKRTKRMSIVSRNGGRKKLTGVFLKTMAT